MEALSREPVSVPELQGLTQSNIPKPLPIERRFRKDPGVGVELEFFALTEDGVPLETIQGLNTATYVLHHMREQYPTEGKKLWCEEASFHLEAISGVHDNVRAAVEETMNVVEAADEILRPAGGRAVLIPVPAHPFKFVKSPSPRADALLADPSWREKRWYTAIASTQINDAQLFANCRTEEERWIRALVIMNSLDPSIVRDFKAHDADFKNHEGKTRLEIIRELIPGREKWEAFQAHGFTNQNHVLYPPEFRDLEHFQSWIRAHGKREVGSDLTQIPDKNIHAGVCKVKRGINEEGELTNAPWMAEFRTMGSNGQTVDEVLQHLSPVTDHIDQLKAQFGL